MARVDVIMPQMGESIAEGTLSKWLKKVGDEVKRDEPIFEISTDKVDAEIPAPAAGVLAEVLVTEGQTVPVQTVVARLETEKGAFAAAPAPAGAGSPGASAPSPAPAAAPAGAPASSAASSTGGPPPMRQATTPGAGSSHQTPAPAIAASQGAPAPSGNGNSFEDRVRTKSSPLVRKIAAEHGIELSAMQGSGVAGRVTKRDILDYIESGAAARGAPPAVAGGGPGVPNRPTPPTVTPSMHAPGGAEPHAPAPEPWPGDVVEPMSRIRQLTAEHMTVARRTAAHVTSFFEVDLTRVARIRARQREAFERATGQKLTYLPFIVKSVVDGLKQFPVLNSVVSGTNVIYRKQFNVGIAVALDWGLIVPVVKGADELSLSGLTKRINDLATRARGKQLKPDEVQGATFTITNPGVFGSIMGAPIIPVGTSAILGVGAIEKRPKVVAGPEGEDTIAIRTCVYLSISFDHRIIDGADADKFMAFVKQQLETFSEQGL